MKPVKSVISMLFAAVLFAGCMTDGRSVVVLPVIPATPKPPIKKDNWIEPSGSNKQVAKGSFGKALLPPSTSELKGSNEVRFSNPNDFSVLVVIRDDEKGRNIEVQANSTATAHLPDGQYTYFIVFGNQPNATFRGDRFSLPTVNQLEIKLPGYSK